MKKHLSKPRVRWVNGFTVALVAIFIVLGETVPPAWAERSEIEALRKQVAPAEGVTIPVEWGNLLPDLKALDAVDAELLNKGLVSARGYGLTATEIERFNGTSREFVRIDNESKTYLMYIFWALAFVNSNPILNSSAHMYENNTSPVGAAKYGSHAILEFNETEQSLIDDIALNSYRPCCNGPTLKPDCSHGFAALGLVEFLVSKGLERDKIFKILLQFNGYSFTDQYIDIALALEEQGQNWSNVNATQVVGYSYSSLEAHQAIREYLIERGIYDPQTREYFLDPLTKYREPILILSATVVAAATIGLVGLIWIRRDLSENEAALPIITEEYSTSSEGDQRSS